MEEKVIELLARTSNKKQVDGLIAKVMSNPTAHILKLEYNKEFKNWCI